MKSDEKDNVIIKGPIQLSIDITNKCNLRCLHCYNFSGENVCIDNELTDNELIKLINDVCKLKPYGVCFCGGETLLRKDIMFKLIKKLTDNNIICSMVSNGILLTKEVASNLKQSGIGHVQISLDGIGDSHDKLRGMNGAYEKAITALENLKEYKIPSSIAFSPTKWNINEFEDVIKIALNVNAEEVRVQELMPIGRASNNTKEILPNINEYRKLRKEMIRLEKILKQKKRNLKLEWGDPIDHFFRFSKNPDFNYMFGIKSDGSISPSMYLPLSVGNVHNHSIIDYWNCGLYKIWNMRMLKDISSNYQSVFGMDSRQYGLPAQFKEKDILVDIIENDVLI